MAAKEGDYRVSALDRTGCGVFGTKENLSQFSGTVTCAFSSRLLYLFVLSPLQCRRRHTTLATIRVDVWAFGSVELLCQV